MTVSDLLAKEDVGVVFDARGISLHCSNNILQFLGTERGDRLQESTSNCEVIFKARLRKQFDERTILALFVNPVPEVNDVDVGVEEKGLHPEIFAI